MAHLNTFRSGRLVLDQTNSSAYIFCQKYTRQPIPRDGYCNCILYNQLMIMAHHLATPYLVCQVALLVQ